MTARRLYIAAYDVSHPRRLRAIMNAARAYATGGQKSVYECFLTPAEKRAFLIAADKILKPGEDRMMLLRLDPRSRSHALGLAVAPVDPPFFYQG